MGHNPSGNAPFDLERFVQAQAPVYASVLEELHAGQKRGHWMWFIFPQFTGLGSSPTSVYYAIKSLAEARQYLAHPVLGPRLLECSRLVLEVQRRSANQIFGSPDDMKLRSCMTLFVQAAPGEPLFNRVLEKYYHGKPDPRSLELIAEERN
jgi:uncharacterized protein (DUF1810 family)